MRVALELLCIIVYFSLGWMVLKNIYAINETANNYSWLGTLALAILTLLFVLHRKELAKNVSVTLISLSVILIITPFILSLL